MILKVLRIDRKPSSFITVDNRSTLINERYEEVKEIVNHHVNIGVHIAKTITITKLCMVHAHYYTNKLYNI